MYLKKIEMPVILDTEEFEANGGDLKEHPMVLNGQYEVVDGKMPEIKVLVKIVPEGESELPK